MPSADLKSLQEKLGHVFGDEKLLTTALTHTSLDRGKSVNTDYERLEFLGDRVLGLVMADYLLAQYPEEGEGDIAKRHSAVVQRAALVDVAEQLDLGAVVRLSQGESASGGRRKHTILADALEAVIAAIYLDGGFGAATGFVQRYWAPLVEAYGTPPQDAKTALQEWAQGQGLPLPVYEVTDTAGPAHAPEFTICLQVETLPPVTATGTSKREAEKIAAEKMLKALPS